MSTVLANTITAVGGGGSTVKVNNDSTYISDGGGVTNHNLVQGLGKVWASFDGSSGSEVQRFISPWGEMGIGDSQFRGGF